MTCLLYSQEIPHILNEDGSDISNDILLNTFLESFLNQKGKKIPKDVINQSIGVREGRGSLNEGMKELTK